MDITRRGLLRWLGLGAAVTVLPLPAHALKQPEAAGQPPFDLVSDIDTMAVPADFGEVVWDADGHMFVAVGSDGAMQTGDGYAICRAKPVE